MAKRNLRVGIILDRSGSMNSCRDVTIDAVNNYVNELNGGNFKGRLSLTLFDSDGIDLLWDAVKFKECPKLDRETYIPRSWTPLYDAVGRTVRDLDSENTDNYDGVVLVIVTDGQENYSKEFTKGAIKQLLDDKQKNDEWLVLYLGANQDSFAEGGAIGTSINTTMDYQPDSAVAAMASASNATMRYGSAENRTMGLTNATFTADEREKSLKKGKKGFVSSSVSK